MLTCYVMQHVLQDGYTKEENGPDSVRVLVATKAKPNRDVKSSLDREYFINFLNVRKVAFWVYISMLLN